jgi:hypothetical protein
MPLSNRFASATLVRTKAPFALLGSVVPPAAVLVLVVATWAM